MCLLSSVLCLLLGVEKGALRFANLVLREFSVKPTYFRSGLPPFVDTVPWYAKDCLRQSSFKGQSAGFLQLQFLVATFFLFSTDLLWPSMLFLMLDMQL